MAQIFACPPLLAKAPLLWKSASISNQMGRQGDELPPKRGRLSVVRGEPTSGRDRLLRTVTFQASHRGRDFADGSQPERHVRCPAIRGAFDRRRGDLALVLFSARTCARSWWHRLCG